MDASGRKRWVLRAILLGVAYFVVGPDEGVNRLCDRNGEARPALRLVLEGELGRIEPARGLLKVFHKAPVRP